MTGGLNRKIYNIAFIITHMAWIKYLPEYSNLAVSTSAFVTIFNLNNINNNDKILRVELLLSDAP